MILKISTLERVSYKLVPSNRTVMVAAVSLNQDNVELVDVHDDWL